MAAALKPAQQRDMVLRFGVHDYQAEHLPVAAMVCRNLHAEVSPPDGKAPVTLHRNEGIRPVWSGLPGPVRGIQRTPFGTFAVCGGQLYDLQAGGSAVELGAIDGAGRVDIANNGTQLGVATSTGALFVYSGGVLAQATDRDLPPVSWIEFFDQYLIYGRKDGLGWGLSALADMTAYDELDIAEAEASPDALLYGIRDGRNLILAGSDSLEFWYNAGLPDFAFDRAPDGVIDVGLAARASMVRLDNGITFLSAEEGGYSVRRIDGRTPVRISHPGIDAWLQRHAEEIPGAKAMGWTAMGHAYYALTVADRTFVYDFATKLWATRSAVTGAAWPVAEAAADAGGVLFGHGTLGTIGRLDPDTHTDFGEPIAWETVTPPQSAGGRMMTWNRVEVEVNAGQGLAEGQGEDPRLWLSWSDDDGATWSPELSRSMGRMGQRQTILAWTQLGSSPSRIFRLRGADPVKTALIAARATVTVGP